MNTKPPDKSIVELLNEKLERLIEIAERISPPPALCKSNCLNLAETFVWHAREKWLQPIKKINYIDLGLLKNIEYASNTLLDNTLRFSQGLCANNALLWGARGMGKSSLIKAVHAKINKQYGSGLKLVEIYCEDLNSLPLLLNELRDKTEKIILFCDDLSFNSEDTSYKLLKVILDGGIESKPENVIFYATSNRRHLLPRDTAENEYSKAINPADVIEEKVSLSDRFGLWLGFHKCSQKDYLEMVDCYADYYNLNIKRNTLHKKALEWSASRGSYSGRISWQFIQDLAGKFGKSLSQ